LKPGQCLRVLNWKSKSDTEIPSRDARGRIDPTEAGGGIALVTEWRINYVGNSTASFDPNLHFAKLD
jgi:hypothetical protein